MKVIRLNECQQRALNLIGTEWAPPPRGFTSPTLLSLRDRGLVEIRVSDRYRITHALTLPYNSRAYEYRRNATAAPQLAVEKHGDTKFSAVLRTMPPLRHSIPGQEFDWGNSEVVQWLVRQPEAMDCIFSAARASGRIAFNKETGRWAGVPAPEVKP